MVFKQKSLFLFSIILIWPGLSFSSVEKAVHFYRSPQSLFSSGQTSLSNLSNSKVRSEQEHSLLVTRDRSHFWLPARKILRDSDLFVAGSPGFAINLIQSTLRKEPKWTADIITPISPHSKMEIIKFESDWAYVNLNLKDENESSTNESLKGYIDLNNVVIAADFASFVMNKNKKWKPVLYRELSSLVLEHNERIDLDQIQSMITLPDRGIVSARDDKYNLSLRNHVHIERVETGEWNVSFLKGHGEVFWKIDEPSPTETEQNYFKTEDILKREITSVAFHPKNPKLGLVSSQGIFLTIDGINWKQLKTFGKQDFPVAINDQGEMIVGIFYSKNNGGSFNPFLKWEHLTKLIDLRAQTLIRNLQIAEVSFSDVHHLKISLDTGLKRVNVSGNPETPDSWKLVY